MKATFKAVPVLLATCLLCGIAQAGKDDTKDTETRTSPGVIQRTGNAIERGAEAAVKGVKRGATVAAKGIEHGARATGKAAHKVGKKVGVAGDDAKAEDRKP